MVSRVKAKGCQKAVWLGCTGPEALTLCVLSNMEERCVSNIPLSREVWLLYRPPFLYSKQEPFASVLHAASIDIAATSAASPLGRGRVPQNPVLWLN